MFEGFVDDVIGGVSNVSENLGSIVDKRNLEILKKRERRNGNYLYVTRETKVGNGVYKVVDKNGDEIYNTLPEFGKSDTFVLRLYKDYGEIADITKRTIRSGGFFSSIKTKTEYYFRSNVYPPGAIIPLTNEDQKKYVTEFNKWMAMGDFTKGNYKFFDQDTGQAIATVSKKFQSASTYMVNCRTGEDEPVIIFMTILIDMIEKE